MTEDDADESRRPRSSFAWRSAWLTRPLLDTGEPWQDGMTAAPPPNETFVDWRA